MTIKENLHQIKAALPSRVTLVVVTKTQAKEKLLEVYNAGHKIFGENKVQELIEKEQLLPKDIEWHLIGHLQTNKVKYIAPFISLIHSVDSLKLLKEINKQGLKNDRIIDCLLQLYIAEEETKFGLSFSEAKQLLQSEELKSLKNIKICGLMGMSTNTENEEQVGKEFDTLKDFFDSNKKDHVSQNIDFQILSMGMSADYQIAIDNGSSLVRIGSSIFGSRS